MTKSITKIVSESIAAQTADLDIEAINQRINYGLQQLAKLETTLQLRINHGDTQLYNWTLQQLMTLKGCLTDRQVLVEQLTAFTTSLQSRLDTAPCADTSGFGPWEGLPVLTETPLELPPAPPKLEGPSSDGATSTASGAGADARLCPSRVNHCPFPRRRLPRYSLFPVGVVPSWKGSGATMATS